MCNWFPELAQAALTCNDADDTSEERESPLGWDAETERAQGRGDDKEEETDDGKGPDRVDLGCEIPVS